MRLIGLLATGLAGYAVYELAKLASTGGAGLRGNGGGGIAENNTPAQEADARRAQLSGSASGEGMRVPVMETDGGTRSAIAGRGVVHG